MVKDTVQGRYKGLGKKNALMIVAGLLYLVNPMDIIPDFIFGIGFGDDLGVPGLRNLQIIRRDRPVSPMEKAARGAGRNSRFGRIYGY